MPPVHPPPPMEDEPPSKKLKTEDSLMPEEEFLRRNKVCDVECCLFPGVCDSIVGCPGFSYVHSLSVSFWDVGQPEEASVYVFNVRSTDGGTESSSSGGGSDSMESCRS